MRVKITDIEEFDAFYDSRNELIGEVIDTEITPSIFGNGWYRTDTFIRENGERCKLNAFKYIEVPEIRGHVHNVEPSAMSELAGWINDGVETQRCKCALEEKPAPKKLTWWQKIRGYDDLQARCNSAEGMRDHYKETLESWESLAISKARELELMTKVADNWQQRLICVQKDYADATDQIGRRLKFSVGHNHIEIIIGNPITLCSNYRTEDKHGDYTDNAISRCSCKDTYDWKKGAIQSLDNLCDERDYSKKLRRDLRKAMAKKYPEVFSESN